MSSPESIAGVTPGMRIQNRYEVKSLLGKGGFASVFRAYDVEIERPVAIKVLNLAALLAGDADPQVMLERFRREAKLAARITHPSVVQIHDFGVLEGMDNPYIIMEVLEGHDLEEELEEKGPLDPRRVLPLFVDALEALGEAHGLDIIHKDLKPSNLFIANPGERRETMKVVDFGIAYIGDDTSDKRLTKTGFMLGTPQYMAPEYVEEQYVSPALDVYQMGLILVEMLAGRAVVDDTNMWKCAMRHVGRELSVPELLLDSPLGPVIERALAADPQDRYGDAGEFAAALESLDHDEIPHLSEDVAWRPLEESLEAKALTPDQETQKLFEEAQSARQEISARTAVTKVAKKNPHVVSKDSEEEDSGQWDTLEAFQSQQGRRKFGVAALGAVLLITAAAVALVVTGEDDLPPQTEEEPVAVDEEKPSKEEEEPVDERADEEPSDDAEAVVVELLLVPEDATVTLDGEESDEAPRKIRFDSSAAAARHMILSHEDYEPMEMEVGPEAGPTLEVELTKLEAEEEAEDEDEPAEVAAVEARPEPRADRGDSPPPEVAEEPEEPAGSAEADSAASDEDEESEEAEMEVEEGEDDEETEEERRDVLMAP